MEEVVVAVIKNTETQYEIVEGYIKGVKQKANVQKVKVEDKDINTLIEEVEKEIKT